MTEKIDLRKRLRSFKFELDILQKIPCSKQENKTFKKLLKDGGILPQGVYPYIYDGVEVSKTEFYTIYETDLTKEEKNEYLTYQKLSYIKTIKNCIVFFTVLAIIGLGSAFLIIINIR